MGKIIPTIISILLSSVLALSQNLVPNGGFESMTACPEEKGEIEKASGWINPNEANPDFFHEC